MCNACTNQMVERAIDELGFTEAVTDMLEEMFSIYNESWTDATGPAIDRAVQAIRDAPNTEAGIAAMLTSLESDLGTTIVTAEKRLELQVLSRGAYQATKTRLAESFGAASDMTPLDIELARVLGEDGPYWIGEFYETHMSARIAAVADDAVIQQGLGRDAGARVMDDALRQEFALTGGKSTYASAVPGKYAGNMEQYNRILTSNVASRVRNFSSITSMSGAGITRYTFVAVDDERTSEVCLEMNGRSFSVRSAMSTLETLAESNDPALFKQLMPWPRNAEQVRTVAGTGTALEQSNRLEEAGIRIPPLHGECRSLISES